MAQQKPEVYFIKGFDKKSEAKFLETLKQELSQVFKSGETIAIKMHMGHGENFNNIQPDFVSKIIKVLDELKINAFIFDTPVLYKSERDSEEGYLKLAEKRGYTKISKVIISNKGIKKKGKYQSYEVAEPLIKADGVLILTHFKGHGDAGIGGSIKNLGMGALTPKSKGDIHYNAKPIFDEKKCIGCGICAQKCLAKDILIEGGKAVFQNKSCFGCGNCILYCQQKAIKPKLQLFEKLLADGAIVAAKSFKKYYCVNVLRNIDKLCDCWGKPGGIIAKDVGFLLSKDIVAIDNASVDLIKKQEGKDVFLEYEGKSGTMQIEEAHDLGGGSLDYNLSEIK